LSGPQGLLNVVGCRSSLRQVIKDRWRGGHASSPLNRKTANADGGPAADGFAKNLKQLVAEHERVEGLWQAQAGRRPTTHF